MDIGRFINTYPLPENGVFPASALETYLGSYPGHKITKVNSQIDPIMTLFNRGNFETECLRLLVNRNFPMIVLYLMEAVHRNDQELYDIMFNGVDIQGLAVKDNMEFYFGVLQLAVFFYNTTPEGICLPKINMVLDSFKHFTPPDVYLRQAIASCDDSFIIILLKGHTQRLSANLARYAIETSKDAAVLSAVLDMGLPVYYKLNNGPTPVLSVVSKEGDALGVFQRLVSSGANIDDHMHSGDLNIYERALHQQDLRQRIKILLLLDKLGAKFVCINSNDEASLMIGQFKTAFDLFKVLNAPNHQSEFARLPLELRSILWDLFMADILEYISRPCFTLFVDRPKPSVDDELWQEISLAGAE